MPVQSLISLTRHSIKEQSLGFGDIFNKFEVCAFYGNSSLEPLLYGICVLIISQRYLQLEVVALSLHSFLITRQEIFDSSSSCNRSCWYSRLYWIALVSFSIPNCCNCMIHMSYCSRMSDVIAYSLVEFSSIRGSRPPTQFHLAVCDFVSSSKDALKSLRLTPRAAEHAPAKPTPNCTCLDDKIVTPPKAEVAFISRIHG